jgi:16S rRNA (uracil1498-N3)-methyltransferase
MDYAIEKATECGVNRFIPYQCESSVVELPDGSALSRKKRRWKNIARAASKQSLRSRIPVVDNPLTWDELINKSDTYDTRIIADGGKKSISPHEVEIAPDKPHILLLVGPEPGFTILELADASDKDFYIMRFGSRRLRAETAAAVIPLILQYIAGELS